MNNILFQIIDNRGVNDSIVYNPTLYTTNKNNYTPTYYK